MLGQFKKKKASEVLVFAGSESVSNHSMSVVSEAKFEVHESLRLKELCWRGEKVNREWWCGGWMVVPDCRYPAALLRHRKPCPARMMGIHEVARKSAELQGYDTPANSSEVSPIEKQ